MHLSSLLICLVLCPFNLGEIWVPASSNQQVNPLICGRIAADALQGINISVSIRPSPTHSFFVLKGSKQDLVRFCQNLQEPPKTFDLFAVRNAEQERLLQRFLRLHPAVESVRRGRSVFIRGEMSVLKTFRDAFDVAS